MCTSGNHTVKVLAVPLCRHRRLGTVIPPPVSPKFRQPATGRIRSCSKADFLLEGKDIWLMGGGELFRKPLDLGEVDSVNITTVPVILGDGTPLMSLPYGPTKPALLTHRVYKSGNISMTYALKS